VVRAIVADDHPLYLDGLVAAVEASEELELVAACTTGTGVVEKVNALAPDVAAIDHQLPGLDAVEVIEALRASPVRPPVLVFSAGADGRAVYDAIQAGAAGYIPKGWPRGRICAAILSVARGETLYAEELHAAVGDEIRRRGGAVLGRFTDREREILGLLAGGLSAPQIATRLFLSVSTVKTHQHRLYEKLGVSDRAAAVAAAMRQGLIR
jgi:two-component system nitrate/nitrite response regulator NarL